MIAGQHRSIAATAAGGLTRGFGRLCLNLFSRGRFCLFLETLWESDFALILERVPVHGVSKASHF